MNEHFSFIPIQWEQQCGRVLVCACITWKTLGALTREARAEESVAEKIPAVMRGPNPDTMLMTWKREVLVKSDPFHKQLKIKNSTLCTCFLFHFL